MSRPLLLDSVAALKSWHMDGGTVGLVPTMGALHGGHLSLTELAAEQADRVIVSVFVNPTQFGPNEDFDRYPRSLEADLDALSGYPVDAVFVPSVAQMYPDFPRPAAVTINAGGIAKTLDGAKRPGHFDGVCQVVAKLFNLVQPDVAVFGQKDAQQLAVIRQMVRDLNFPVRIVAAPIVRESDGLALSSRNVYLTGPQRGAAPVLHQALLAGVEAARTADGEAAGLAAVTSAMKKMESEPLVAPEYAAVVRSDDFTLCALAGPGGVEHFLPITGQATLLVAAQLGDTRLIDNYQWRAN